MPTISGTTTNADGILQPNTSIMLQGAGIEPRIAITGNDGIYTFTDVPAGKYKLTAVVGHSVTERIAEVETNQTNNTVVDFRIVFFRPKETWVEYFQRERFLLLKYGQYAFLGFIAWLFFSSLVTDQIGNLGIGQLQSPEKARGVITYLIAVTTIGMATILMVASIMIGGKEVKERFALGKEILTLLIGILGTIIGFYYGSAKSDSTEKPPADIKTSLLDVTPSGTSGVISLTITGKIEEGEKPYSYTLTSDKNNLFKELPKEKSSTDGVISEVVTLKQGQTANQAVKFTLMGRDNNKRPFNRVKDYTIILTPTNPTTPTKPTSSTP